MIDVCDVVHHAPSGENWVVACVDGDRLYWVGYPYGGSAALSDCQLVTKASDKDRQSLLEKLAELTGFDVPTLRARARLTQLAPDKWESPDPTGIVLPLSWDTSQEESTPPTCG